MEPEDKSDMNLPLGKTCSNCAHINWCALMFAVDGAEVNCYWSPSRFQEVVKP